MNDISDEELQGLVEEDSQESEEEVFTEDIWESHVRKPKAYQHLSDAQYNRCQLRERFVGLSYSDKRSAMRYLRENERRFRMAGFDDTAKQEMYRGITWDGFGNLTTEDVTLLTSVFGLRQTARPTPFNTQATASKSSYRPPNTPNEWMHEMKFSTFPRFRSWMNDGSNKRILDELDDYGRDCLCDAIEYQLHTNYILPFQENEGFKDEDMVWINQI